VTNSCLSLQTSFLERMAEESDDTNLSDMFEQSMKIVRQLDGTDMETNSPDFQVKSCKVYSNLTPILRGLSRLPSRNWNS